MKAFRFAALLVSAACLSFSLVSEARAEVAIETSLSRSRVAIGEELTLDFIITNASGRIAKPRFIALDGFTSYSQGHSQELSIINGRSSSKSIFSYVLIANSVGKKTIGPFEIDIDSKTYKVAAVDIEVTPFGGASPTQQPFSFSQQGPVSAPNARSLPQGSVGDRDIFVKVWIDKDEVYVNEPATLTYTLYTRLSATYKGFEKEPVLTGFWSEDFPPEKTIKRTEQMFEGARYVVADVRKISIFPTEAGVFTIDPGVLSAVVEMRGQEDFDRFFSSNIFGRRPFPPSFAAQLVQKSIPADKVVLTVKALPEAGKPASFRGTVGDYRIETSVDKTSVTQGDPVTFRVKITGRGNINTLEMPALPPLDDFKTYDSSTATNISKDRLIVEGDKVTETVIVPKKAGTFTLPSLSFAYFNPKTGAYKEEKTPPQVITVKPGAFEDEEPVSSSGVQPADKEEVAVLGKDIRYIKTADTAPAKPVLYRSPLYWALNAVLFLAVLLFTALSGKRNVSASASGASRARGSHRVARTRLKSAAACMKKGDRDGFYAETSKALYGYFGDRLGLPAQSVTFETIQARLSAGQTGTGEAAAPAVADTKKLFDDLSLGRFARVEHGPEEMKEIYGRAERVITAFEKVRLS